MKKIIPMVIMALLFSLSSLLASASHQRYYQHEINEELEEFDENGGSQAGRDILGKAFNTTNTKQLIEIKTKIKTLKRDVERIAIATNFNEAQFKAKVLELHTLIAKYLTKKYEMKTSILSQLNQSDREAYMD